MIFLAEVADKMIPEGGEAIFVLVAPVAAVLFVAGRRLRGGEALLPLPIVVLSLLLFFLPEDEDMLEALAAEHEVLHWFVVTRLLPGLPGLAWLIGRAASLLYGRAR